MSEKKEVSTETLDRIERVYVLLEEKSLDEDAGTRGSQAWFLREIEDRTGEKYTRTSVYRWVREEHPLPTEVEKTLVELEGEARRLLKSRLAPLT